MKNFMCFGAAMAGICAVMALEGPSVYKMTEAQLIGVAKAGGLDDRMTACQELAHRGSAASVPALATMLAEKEPSLFHSALYALQNIPGGEVDAALAAAEEKASPDRRPAIAHVRAARAGRVFALEGYAGATEALTVFPAKTPAQKGDMAAFAAAVDVAIEGGRSGTLARFRLIGFPGSEADRRLLEMARGDDAKKARLALGVLGERKARCALPALLEMARKPTNERMRRGALNALAQICDARTDMPELLKLLKLSPDDEQMRGVLVRVAAPAFVPSARKVDVVEARFGNFDAGRVADVKLMVDSLIAAGAREIMSGCRLVGRGGFHRDPAPGMVKELRIAYSVDGAPVRRETVPENSMVSFGENVLPDCAAKPLVEAALKAKGAFRDALVHVICALDRRGVVPGAEAVLFRPIFNGRNLAGWKQDGGFFSAKEGVLVGESTPEKPCRTSQYLVYSAEQFSDFELRCSFRLSKGANSGFQVRSTDSTVKDTGYQVDMNGTGSIAGYLYCTGQHLVGRRGCDVAIAANGLKSVVPFADDKDMQKAYRPGEWNDMRVIAKGSMLAVWINGVRTVSVMDPRPEYLPAKGFISIQLHQGHPMKAEFRDLCVRTADVTMDASLETSLLQRLEKLKIGSAPSFEGCQWIWHGNGFKPATKVAFRAELELPKGEIEKAGLVFSCDDGAVFSVNGREVARQTDGRLWYTPTAAFGADRLALAEGRNVVEVSAFNNEGNAAALLAVFEVEYKDGRLLRFPTGARGWKASLDGRKFEPAVEVCPYGAKPYGKFGKSGK